MMSNLIYIMIGLMWAVYAGVLLLKFNDTDKDEVGELLFLAFVGIAIGVFWIFTLPLCAFAWLILKLNEASR